MPRVPTPPPSPPSPADTGIFRAALKGDLETLRLLVDKRDTSTAEGYTALSLSVSAGHAEVARMLLASGVTIDAADFQGVTALMHAAMHGYTVIINMLLLHGANPMKCRLDGKNAIGLAAEYGRPAALGAFFRHDNTLVECRDTGGRTPLLCAVMSRHTPTVKYMLGLWDADPFVTDGGGNSALHICRGSVEILLLLVHCKPERPDLRLRNDAGLTPSEAMVANGETALAELIDETTLHGSAEDITCERSAQLPKTWIFDTERLDRQLFAFMLDSPMRRAPPVQLPTCCIHRISLSQALYVPMPFTLLVASAFGATLSLATAMQASSALAWLLFHIWAHRNVQRIDPTTVQSPALLLFDALVLLTLAHVLQLEPVCRESLPILTHCTSVGYACYWLVYARLMSLEPGAILLEEGQRAQARAAYWDEVEKLQPGQFFPDGFCAVSEMRRPARSAYSKMSDGLIRVMDHDCPWVAGSVGAGNHCAFVLMTIVGQAALTVSLVLQIQAPVPNGFESWAVAALSTPGPVAAGAQLVLGAFVVSLLLNILLVPILVSQCYFVAINVTTRELIKWQKNRRPVPMPWQRSSSEWKQFAPYDRGILHNVYDFIACKRDDVQWKSLELEEVSPA